MKLQSLINSKQNKRVFDACCLILLIISIIGCTNSKTVNEVPAQPTLLPVASETPTNQVPIELEISSIDSFTDREFIHANLRISGNPNIRIQNIDFSKIDLLNASGEKIGIEPINLNRDYNPEIYPLGIATTSKTNLSAMKLVISDISFVIENPNLQLTVDYGDHPYDGETIEINQNFSDNGVNFKIEKILLHLNINNEPSQTIEVTSDGELKSISFTSDDLLHFPEESLSGNSIFVETIFLSRKFPKGKRNITIDSLVFHQNGPWRFDFSATNKELQSYSKPTNLGVACILPSTYKELISKTKASISNNDQGLLVIHTMDENYNDTYSILRIPNKQIIYQISNKSIAPLSIKLSPNGRYLIYTPSDSPSYAHIIDLYSLTETIFPEEISPSENSPIFTADNKKVAYLTNHGKIVIRSLPDFQLLHEINGWIPIGWLNLDQSILWWKPWPKAGGGNISATNISSNKLTNYFSGNLIYWPMELSKDTKQIILGDKIPNTESTGIYLANLDGSTRQLIIYNGEPNNDDFISWAPDGKSIIWSVENNLNHYNILINLDTCETSLLDLPNVEVLQWVNGE